MKKGRAQSGAEAGLDPKEDWARRGLVAGGLLSAKAPWSPIGLGSALYLVRLDVKGELIRAGWEPVCWLIERRGKLEGKVGRIHQDGWWQAAAGEWHRTGTPGAAGIFRWGVYDSKSDSAALKEWGRLMEKDLGALVERTDQLREQRDFLIYEKGVLGQVWGCWAGEWLKQDQVGPVLFKWLVDHRIDNPVTSAARWYGELQKELQGIEGLTDWQRLGVAIEGVKAWLDGVEVYYEKVGQK